MKNLLKCSFICAIATTFFASCSSNLSITKRHYNSGYYIDYVGNSQSLTASKEKNQNKPVEIAIAPENNVISNSTRTGKDAPQKTTVPVPESPNIKPNYKAERKPGIAQAIKITNEAKESKQVVEKAALSESSYKIAEDDRPARAALSLLWLVIVIVLILWLIGIILGGFGLGGLINLLLVIALILLILWLLRII